VARFITLEKVVVGGLLLAILLVIVEGRGPHVAAPRPAPPPTPAALAFQQAQAEAAERAEAVRRQAEAAQAITQPAEEETVLPEGHGRAETFGYCVACHSTAIIRRSHFSRDQWEGLMDWMTEKHGMNALEGELRQTIVDYLATHFGPRQAPARGGNPFLN
jgi:mono/diheme cytochrome c family protein